MVISRSAGTTLSTTLPVAGSSCDTLTSRLASCGRNFATGSLRRSLPSSISIIAATEANGFVIE